MRKQFILSETYMKHVNTSFNRRVMSQIQYIFWDINARKYPQTKSKKIFISETILDLMESRCLVKSDDKKYKQENMKNSIKLKRNGSKKLTTTVIMIIKCYTRY